MYGIGNQRVYKKTTGGNQYYYFCGAQGEMLEVFEICKARAWCAWQTPIGRADLHVRRNRQAVVSSCPVDAVDGLILLMNAASFHPPFLRGSPL